MFIYICILFILFFLGLMDVSWKMKYREKKLIFGGVIIFFWILSFIRWETGTDWDSYLDFFLKNNSLDDFQYFGLEPLFTYLNYVVKLFTDQYWVLLLIIGAFIYCLTSPTIYRYSPYPFISLLVYLMLRKADIFFVRESIALALCFFSVRYIIHKQFWKFAITIMIAVLFHRSMIVFVPAFFIFHMDWDFRKSVIIIIILVLFVLMAQSLVGSEVVKVAGFFGDSFFYKAEHYIEDNADYLEGGANVAASIIRGLFNRGVILSIMLYAYHKTKDSFLKGITNLYIVSIGIFVTLYPISVVLSRLYNSYDMFCILGVAYFFKAIPRNNIQFFYMIVYIYLAMRFVVGTLLGAYSYTLVPYKTIF